MKGNIVLHKKFGRGTVIDEAGGYLTIAFDSAKKEKIFKYPDSFGKFLVFADEKLQKEAKRQFAIVDEKRRKEEEEKLAAYIKAEQERKKEKEELLKKKRREARAKLEREKKKKKMA